MSVQLRCLCLTFYQNFRIFEKRKTFFIPLTGDVDIVHVGGWDLFTNLCDQIQDELDIISLTLLRVNIPRTRGFLVNIVAFSVFTSFSRSRWEPR